MHIGRTLKVIENESAPVKADTTFFSIPEWLKDNLREKVHAYQLRKSADKGESRCLSVIEDGR